ncbi:MAG: hypothetical protein LBS99_00590 [Clostridiales bacterium]|jgi:beta-N-acetylhexosaminidase|nr:hypothetical protein [Clostridiales bacterium]
MTGSLTAEQKIGQLIFARNPGDTPEQKAFVGQMLRNKSLGGVQVSVTPGSKRIIDGLKSRADYPVLIGNDMEKGYPGSDLGGFPMISLAATDNPEYAYSFAKATAINARVNGYNTIWGPVVDLKRSNAPASIDRKLGDSAEGVSKLAEQICRAFYEAGIVCAAKHYPGGEDVPMDTHMAEGVSFLSEKELLEADIQPYIRIDKSGYLSGIMTQHRRFVNIDGKYPASLSPKLHGIIRKQGFDGLIFSDSLAMMGIVQKFGELECLVLAINAGTDIVLPSYRLGLKQSYEYLVKAYREGRISQARINEAYARVRTAQLFTAKAPEFPLTVTDALLAHDRAVAKDCITEISRGAVPPPAKDERRLFVVLTPQNYGKAATVAAEINNSEWYYPKILEDKIAEEFPACEIVELSEFPTAEENDRLFYKAAGFSDVILVTYCKTSCYLGTDCLTRRVESVISALVASDKVSALVHFGNPCAAEALPYIPRIIFGYSAQKSLTYAIDVLAGNFSPKGKLPFRLKLHKEKYILDP